MEIASARAGLLGSFERTIRARPETIAALPQVFEALDVSDREIQTIEEEGSIESAPMGLFHWQALEFGETAIAVKSAASGGYSKKVEASLRYGRCVPLRCEDFHVISVRGWIDVSADGEEDPGQIADLREKLEDKILRKL